MITYKTLDGNEACARIAYLFTEIAGIYPITPASPMAELIDEWSNKGEKNIFNDQVKVVEMQSEGGVAGFVHGVLQSGCLATTFTSSQGLLLMIPNMYKIAGELLPCVIHVASRTIATHALSILGDHQDIYATRATGFAILASSSVQQITDLAAISHLSAIKSRIPFLHFFDGFRTSHEIQKIKLLTKEDIIDLVDFKAIANFRNRSLSPSNQVIRGTTHNEDIYFQATEARNKDYELVVEIVNDYMEKIHQKTGRDYQPFNYYGNKEAKRIIIAMGSICETIKETIDYLNGEIGLIEVHLYRPFSAKYFFKVLPKTVERIAVLDRTKEAGSSGEPLYLDVVSLFNKTNRKPIIIGGRYGLSGKDITPAHIKSIYSFLDSDHYFHGFTVGIDDDVTHLSIPIIPFTINLKDRFSLLIYGYGSDGMISCAKNIIRIIGDNTNNKVQAYFQYDSKKSGGITRGHLRIASDDIRAPYLVSNPNILVCAKESYLGRYDMLSLLKNDGIFLYVSTLDETEIIKSLPYELRSILINKRIKFYVIDAYQLANKSGLKNKISTIIETCLFKLTNFMPFEDALFKIKENVKLDFAYKGDKIVEANLKAVTNTIYYLKEIHLKEEVLDFIEKKKITKHLNNDIFKLMSDLKGNDLKVSAFKDYKDGTFIKGTSQYEKRGIAENVPAWNPENCIQCNLCSFVCPHAVIRPFLLTEEEYQKAPLEVKEKALKAIGNNYYFQIGISTLDCTGCGICAKICPGKDGNKALRMKPFDEINHQNGFDYLVNEVTVKKEVIKNNVKASQFQKPLFEFSGACAGCGETPYLKLLTQLFNDRLIIANATGCSSIYGASMPSMPYLVPWANSLFEDNAEYGFGMVIAYQQMRKRIENMMIDMIDNVDEESRYLFELWLNDKDDYEVTKEVYERLDYQKVPFLEPLKEYLKTRSVWAVGGDGWAYDIGFGGIDHVLASHHNINILVLDTQVYSNTGGQLSKASEKGSVSKFSISGKDTIRKDLARMMMTYKHAYIAEVSLGANMKATLDAFIEAEKHKGPSLIIAYATCILHGIKNGMEESIEHQKKAVACGYFPIFRYNPTEEIFKLDYNNPNFDLFDHFLDSENRFTILKNINQKRAAKLRMELKKEAKERFAYYQSLEK